MLDKVLVRIFGTRSRERADDERDRENNRSFAHHSFLPCFWRGDAALTKVKDSVIGDAFPRLPIRVRAARASSADQSETPFTENLRETDFPLSPPGPGQRGEELDDHPPAPTGRFTFSAALPAHYRNNEVVQCAVGPRGHNIKLVSNDNNNSVVTLAGRFGFAVDHLLFYGKAGGGWVGNNNYTVNDLTTPAFFATTVNNTRIGWLVGGGLEWAFTNNWTMKLEYDYLGLTSQSFTVPGTAIPVLAGDTFNTGNNNVQLVKLGINYLFPVTAGY